MSIWNKILLFLLAVVALVFFYTAVRTLKTYVYWSNQTAKFEKKLDEVRADIASLKTADHDHPRDDKSIGVQQLRSEVGRLLANRGRIWVKCEKQTAAISPEGILKVAISSDDSSTFTDKMLVYAFEEGDDQTPGNYLGEYHVEKVSEKKIELASTAPMARSPDPTKKVKYLADNALDSKSPWVLYELMPTDEDEAFANIPEDQKKWVAKDILEAAQAGTDNKESDKKPDKKSNRPMRDYLAIFRACEMYDMLYQDRVNSTENDLKYLTGAGEAVRAHEALVEKEKTDVATQQARARAELKAVSDHLAATGRMLTFNEMAVKAAIDRNLQSSAEIARIQKQAADLIDRRMRSMAQFGPGAN